MGFVFDWISIFARLAAHAAMTKLSLPHTAADGFRLPCIFVLPQFAA